MTKIGDFKPLIQINAEKSVPKKAEDKNNAVLSSIKTIKNDSIKGELNNLGAMRRISLNNALEKQKDVVAVLPKPLNPPKSPPVDPKDALQEIKNTPKPKYEDTPSNLPPLLRLTMFQQQTTEYNKKIAGIADYSIKNSQPPKREDFNNLPKLQGNLAFLGATLKYNSEVAELESISRTAKQANLETNFEYRKLPEETKQKVKDSLVKNQGNVADVETLIKLAQSPGFNKLTPAEQIKFIDYVGGTNKEISAPARRALNTLLDNPLADKSNPETFRKFMREQPGLAYVVSGTVTPGEFDARRSPYKISGPEEIKNHKFASGKEDTLRYTVEIDGRKIRVYIGKNQKPGEFYPSIDEVAKGLAALPPAVRRRVDSVQVDPHQNPQDAYWAKQYGIPGFRSYMTAGKDGVISIYPTLNKQSQESLDTSMVHETGHIISKQVMGETGSPLRGISDFFGDIFGKTTWNDWKSAMGKDSVYPSQYARSGAAKSPDEDFAESMALYVQVKGTPREAELRAIFPERFNLLDKILGYK